MHTKRSVFFFFVVFRFSLHRRMLIFRLDFVPLPIQFRQRRGAMVAQVFQYDGSRSARKAKCRELRLVVTFNFCLPYFFVRRVTVEHFTSSRRVIITLASRLRAARSVCVCGMSPVSVSARHFVSGEAPRSDDGTAVAGFSFLFLFRCCFFSVCKCSQLALLMSSLTLSSGSA